MTNTNILQPTRIAFEYPVEFQKIFQEQSNESASPYLLYYYVFFLLLKAETTTSLLKNFDRQISTLSERFKISEKLFSIYIAQIITLRLAANAKNNLHLIAWKRFGKMLSISVKKRIKLVFRTDMAVGEFLAKISTND